METKFPEKVAARGGEAETNPNVINVTRIEPSFRIVQSFHLADFRCESRRKKSQPFLADPKRANLPTFGNVSNHPPCLLPGSFGTHMPIEIQLIPCATVHRFVR